MTTGSDQHADEYKELQTTLELYPSIKITRVEGDPPDHYEIEYHLKGYVRNPDGSIATAKLHRVRITLPFGYPHFPPTVKPLTHIFHPDIDPAAIRIAEHWQAKPKLSDLVLTIGEMICGNIYSTDNPFNQEAADWYENHRIELPLDILKIADIDDDDERFDTLDDDTFSSLGLDDDLFEPEQEEDEGQIDLLRLQLEQKNYFTASKILSEIPLSTDVPGRDALEQTIASALRESDKLFKKAEQLEDEGRLSDAADVVKEIELVVADAPGLDNLRKRILQSQSLADSFSLEKEEPFGKTMEEEGEPSSPPPPPKTKPAKPRISAGPSIPVKSILVAGILILLLIAGGLLYLGDKKIMDKGLNDLDKIHSLIRNNQFDEALVEGESLLRHLDNIKILKSARNSLHAEVTTLLNSDSFQQGLQGNILYDGVYVSFEKAKKLKELASLTEKAEAVVKQGKIREALTIYQDALRYSQQHNLAKEAQGINHTINNLRFEEAIITAEKAEREKEWENAADTYQRALELSHSLSDFNEAEKISERLTAATFRLRLDQSKKSFTAAQWQETISMLENAQQLIQENPHLVSPKEKKELNLLLLNSRLYQLLTLGREAYERREWTESIDQYQSALNLLDSEREGFGPDSKESYTKIEKTLLMMQIAYEQSKAAVAKQENKLEEVLNHYNKILELIKNSKFQREENIQEISNNTKKQRTETQSALEIERKEQYLRENFKKIFTKHYPSFADSKLEHPKVRFLKNIGKNQLFTISCVERSHGSSSRLELQYLYNPEAKRWSLYTGQ